MPINLLVDNVVEWASGGQIEEISIEKRKIGWTGSPSDYAYNVWINSIWNAQDKRSNLIASTINQILQKGIPDYNALYMYKVDSVVTYAGKIYRAKQVNAGSPPPSGQVSNEEWELIAGQDWINSQLDSKANIESASLTGIPTAPTPQNQDNIQQIANVEYVEKEILKRVRGYSVIDLTTQDANKAYPILLAKADKATDSIFYRDVGFGSPTNGNMRLVVRGIGSGLNNKNLSFLEVINFNDSSGASIQNFVKKIQCRNQNTCIVVWLKGGTKYHIDQRNSEEKWELITSAITLEDNWLVSVEEWIQWQHIGDGVWSLEKQTEALIDYSSTSDTGSVETCGVIGYTAAKTPPLGALIADGSAISRSTYSKLFNKIGVWYGVGDGQSTFNLPDLRGVVPRGLDLGRGLDSNQLVTKAYQGEVNRMTIKGLGSYQSDAIRNISGRTTNQVATSLESWNRETSGAIEGVPNNKFGQNGTRCWVGSFDFNASRVVPTTSGNTAENQVKNIALLPFIYYI